MIKLYINKNSSPSFTNLHQFIELEYLIYMEKIALILSILLLVTNQQCLSSPTNDLTKATKIRSSYCDPVLDSSCCSSKLFDSMASNFSTSMQTFRNNFTTLYNKYTNKITQVPQKQNIYFNNKLQSYKVSSNERELISFAAAYTEISAQQLFAFEAFKSFQELTDGMKIIQLKMQTTFDQCYVVVSSSEAGMDCLMCSATFLSTSVTPDFISVSLNVCIKLMKECFPYIDSRIQMAAFVNVVNMLKVLVDDQVLANKLISDQATFDIKTKFANLASLVKMDKFSKPNECNDQFDCRFICNEYITKTGLDYEIILNPTQSYSDDFRRVLEILDEMKTYQRRQRRQLIFYVQEFTTKNGIKYTLEGNNTIEVGEKSNFNLHNSMPKLQLALVAFLMTLIFQ